MEWLKQKTRHIGQALFFEDLNNSKNSPETFMI